MNYILFDDQSWEQLLPLTFTRPVSELRVGILKIREKWERLLNCEISAMTRGYLSQKFFANFEKDNILINSGLIPSQSIVNKINNLKSDQALMSQDRILAICLKKNKAMDFNYSLYSPHEKNQLSEEIRIIERPWHIFSYNGDEIRNDIKLITTKRKSGILNKSNSLLSAHNIFAEDGVKAEYVTINADAGPVYLGKNSEIMEGSVIRGPFALCENSSLKLSAKIYPSTTIGPYSTVGGEVKNSVIQGFSNKAHDGFLGDSVIGEWCNIGADSNNSNLKNNYADVKLWSYPENKFISTGLQFCGLIMGDHSKCGINTMFNTGTVVGVNVNIFGSGFHVNFIPSFSWGEPGEYTVYNSDKAFQVAEKVMSRRNMLLDEKEKAILVHIYNLEEKYRGK